MTYANEWEAFFDGHAPYYREEPFTRNTAAEAGVFDPLTLLEVFTLPLKGAGEAPSQPLRERGFVPSELALMLNSSGLQMEHIWGGTAGSWLRQPPGLDEMELMAIARKPG
ncbi:MAG TPA: hypothetical protein VI410_05925 [Anaerolineales bacterium]|nr:hypothetical protein [Anaerolineales bacterium]